MQKKFALRIFEGFSIQRWNDLIRPFELVEMDAAGEKIILAYIIGKFEEAKGKFVDWKWMAYASLFDLLRKISLSDIKAPVQQLLKKEYASEYLRLNEWALSQYKNVIDENLFLEFQTYIQYKCGEKEIPDPQKLSYRIYNAAHKFATMREMEMLSLVNEKERLQKIRIELHDLLLPFMDLEGVQKLVKHEKAFEFVLKIEQLRFQTRWNQTPRIPKTSVLGHSFFVALFTLLLSRETSIAMCEKRIVNNFFSALFHDLPEAVTRDIISPVKQATDALPDIVKKIEDEISSRELFPLMEDFFRDELLYFSTNEFSNRVQIAGETKIVSFDELNEHYNENKFNPIDGKLVRLSDHAAALMEASSSISHGITSEHLVRGKNGMLSHYKKGEKINGIDASNFFLELVSE